jgi:alpha-beta hydrolase superfamily lysophospholipase
MRTEPFDVGDGFKLVVHRNDVSDVRGVVLIVHGMAEHGARYQRFAEQLANIGYATVAPDLRGHGATSRLNGLRGSFGNGGYMRVIQDLEILGQALDRIHPNAPIVVLGHSMGSMLATVLAERQEMRIDKLILSAFPEHPGVLVHAGMVVSRILSLVSGADTPSTFMDQLTFGKFSRGIANRRTDFDWLSRDPREVDAYIADDACGEVFTVGFFGALARLTDDVHKNLSLLAGDLPMMYIGGGDDPVVGRAKGFDRNVQKIKQAVPHLQSKLYPGGRHELLNDICRDEVITDLKAFILHT